VVLVGVCIVVANLPYLIGWFDPNPMLQTSGLGVHVRPGVIPGRSSIDANAGYTSQALAHRAVLDWLHGNVPWWNPFEGLGVPLAGEMQCAAFFPFTVLLAFANGQLYLYLLLELIAAYSTYFLLRRLAVTEWAAFVGAVVFGLNGTFAWFRLGSDNPICFLPFILLCAEITRERVRDGRRALWPLIAVGVALSIVAGFPETAYVDGLLAVVWILVRGYGLPRAELRRYLTATAGAAVTGVAMAAPVLVAFADYLPHAFLAENSANLATTYVPAPGIADLFFPYVYGPLYALTPTGTDTTTFGILWLSTGGYLTVAAVLLAVIGLFGREHRPLKIALAIWTLIMVARSYGNPAAAELLNLVPGLSHVATYRYMNPSVELAVAVLAAFGVRDLIERRTRQRPLLLATAIVAVVTLLVAKDAHDYARSIFGDAAWEKASLTWAFGTLILIAVIVVLQRASPGLRRAATVALVALLPIEAVAMLVVPEFAAPRGGQIDTTLVAYLQDHVGSYRVFSLDAVLVPNYGSYYGIPLLDADDIPTPKNFEHMVQTSLDPNAFPAVFDGTHPLNPSGKTSEEAFERYVKNYQSLGVKYVVLPSTAPAPAIPSAPLHEVYHDALAAVYQLPQVGKFFQDTAPGCTIRTVTQQEARVDCPEPSILIRNELAMAGWTVHVDRMMVQLGTSSLAQEAVKIPAGTHTVSYAFEPAYITFAWLVAIVGIIACIGSTGITLARRRRIFDTRRRGRRAQTPRD
jgi:hypothetical protein